MPEKQDNKDWTTKLIEKNAWAILIFVASIIYFIGSFFTGNDAQIAALAKDVDRMEEAIVTISKNQQDILVLQEKQNTSEEDILEIKQNMATKEDVANLKELITKTHF